MAWQLIAIWTLVVPAVLWFAVDERQEHRRRRRAARLYPSPAPRAAAEAQNAQTFPGLSPAYRAFLQTTGNQPYT
ncbi:hypothetical protein [Devosia sp. 919]|uniref:hypothetical protein n=1 Tax=Devosia sp. 919 TaxID=2726065 RepID=UPI00155450EF|nr:hypothetical protein [Devosia sp. 919]